MNRTVTVLACVLAIAGIAALAFAGAQNNWWMTQNPANQNTPSQPTSTQPAPTSTPVTPTSTTPEPPQDPLKDLIRVTSPQPNALVQSPLRITGEARGNWYFEASFPVRLIDGNGRQLAIIPAQAQGEWMTESFVPFVASLSFANPTTATGTLILEKDNPSGLPEHAAEVRIPVRFSPQQTSVQLYYYNASKDKDSSGNILCSRQGLVATNRMIPKTITPIQDAIKELLKGVVTAQEQAQGLTTEYPLPGFSLKGANLKNGILTLEFNDSQNKTTGGACRVGVLWYQIEATAKQFPGVNQVVFKPDTLFQP